jgi:arylsulfatase A-like enzyme
MIAFRITIAFAAVMIHATCIAACQNHTNRESVAEVLANRALPKKALSKKVLPNIVWIVADDLGYNDLSCMGQTNFKTPNIDSLAADGMRFTQFYAGSTVCAPSRACFLTGQHTGHVFQRINGPIQFRENPQDVTIATRLQQAGYRTAMIGKSGLSCNSYDAELPRRKGFDHFFGFVNHHAAHRYYPRSILRNGSAIEFKDNTGKEGQTYSTDLMIAEALTFLDDCKAQPFFLHLALQQPHADMQVPPDFLEPFSGKFEEQPQADGFYRAVAEPKATFLGMMSHLDQAIGKVRNHIRKLGIEKNTIIMFTSDNGPHFENGHRPDHFDSNGKLRGGKRDLYEGGIRVPLIACWPEKIEPGSTSNHVSAFWDFPATACELAGIDAPEGTDGLSFVPTLLGKGKQTEHDYLYWEFHEQNGKQAVRMGKWKGIRLNVKDDINGPIELYDLLADVGETRNVAKQHPQIVKSIAEKMQEAHVPTDMVSFVKPSKFKPVSGDRIEGGKLLDRSDWKVIAVSSPKGRLAALRKAFDDNPQTIWMTRDRDRGPHFFEIDFGSVATVSGIRILNRQDQGSGGMIGDLRIYLSETPQFGAHSASVYLPPSDNEQRIPLEAVSARYLRVEIKSDVYDRPFASIAELNVELAN